MKYNININQYALHETGLDLVDAALLDFLANLHASNSQAISNNRIKDAGATMTWVSYSEIIKQMPMLGIKTKSTISARIKKLEDAGMIQTITKEQRTYYCMGSAYQDTQFRDQPFAQTNSTVRDNERDRSHKRTDNNIKDNNTIDNNNTNVLGFADEDDELTQNLTKPQPRKSYGDPDVDRVVEKMESVLGGKLKNVRRQRRSAYLLIQAHGVENVCQVIDLYAGHMHEKYAPLIANLTDLWDKWDKLGMYLYKQKNSSGTVGKIDMKGEESALLGS